MRISLPWVLILAALPTFFVARLARADHDPTCGDAFDQSQVKRDDGKLLEARRLLRVCDGPSCSPTQQKLCSEWLADVEARVPSFVLAAKDRSGRDLVDVKVTMDVVQLATKLDGRAIDVDPGPHSFVFELTDGTRTETKAVANERGKGTVVSVTMGPAPALAGPSEPPLVAGPSGPPLPETKLTAGPTGVAPVSGSEARPLLAGSNSAGSALRTAGFVVGAAGVVGLALGAVFGVEALSTKSAHCKSGLCDPGTASEAYGQAKVSTVGLVAGGVLLAGGVTLLLVVPKGGTEGGAAKLAVAPAVGFATGGLMLAGTW